MVDPLEVVQSNFEAKPVANMWCSCPLEHHDTAPPHFGRRSGPVGQKLSWEIDRLR